MSRKSKWLALLAWPLSLMFAYSANGQATGFKVTVFNSAEAVLTKGKVKVADLKCSGGFEAESIYSVQCESPDKSITFWAQITSKFDGGSNVHWEGAGHLTSARIDLRCATRSFVNSPSISVPVTKDHPLVCN